MLTPGAQPRVVLEGSSFARVVPGWILFVRGTTILAAPFDAERLEVSGPPVGLTEPIVINEFRRTAFFAVAPNGTLVFVAGPPIPTPKQNVMRVDRSGPAVALPLAPAITRCPDCRPMAPASRSVATTEWQGGCSFSSSNVR